MSKVELYVYDLSNGLARQLSRQLTGRQIDGIWHTSVVVYGKEIFYGQGIATTRPGGSHHGRPLQIVDMGETAIDESTFNEYLDEMRGLYTADKYHLLDFNCNSFTNDVVGFLTGGSIPAWIKDLPTDFLSTPFGAALRPTIDNMYRRPAGAAPGVAAPPAAPNTGLTASLLQAVAAQAASGAAPAPPAIPATQTVAGGLQVSSNAASFNGILSAHKAVAAFFTSPTCAPCKMVEPLFESLAEEKAGPGVAFVKIDFSVGRSGEIAEQYGVRATPTFLFFLDGKKTAEVKGANAPELKSQVDLMLFTAFPPHPHLALPLKAVRAMSTNAILFSQVPALDSALTKFCTFIDAAPETFDKSAVKATLSNSFVPFLKKRFSTPPVTVATPTGTIAQWASSTTTLANALPAHELFPLADLWRLAVTDTTVASYLAADATALTTLLGKATASIDAPNARNLTLTALRLATNALGPEPLARRLLQSATALLVPALLHADARVRAAAASLAFNAAALFQRPLMEAARYGRRGPAPAGGEREGEWEVELLSALVEAVGQERESEDVVHRLVAALAMLVHLSPHYEEQDQPLLEVLQARQSLLSSIEEGGCVKKPEVKALVKEVAEQLCP